MNFDKSVLFYRRLIKAILSQLDEDYLVIRINKLLEQAAADFKFVEDGQLSYEEFIDLVGAFVGHLYRQGGLKRSLTQQQSIAEAIYILESGYHSSVHDRLDHAFLDVQEYGVAHIFSFLVSFIGESARQSHVSFVMKGNLSFLTWAEKKIIAKILLDDWERFLPAQIRVESPENYADQLPQLFEMISAINNQADQYFNKGQY